MSMPLSILPLLGADFDGDALNILYIINKEFLIKAEEVLNPRNCLNISHNDGLFDNQVNRVVKDTTINANSMVELSRCYYDQNTLDLIAKCKSMYAA